MATIKDVAMDAGVSVGTVSNVINGGNVSEERRQRVEQSIQKLGYQVNGIARKMRTQRTDYVVVILPDITNPFYSLLLQGLEHALSAYDKQPLLCISDGEKEKEIKYIEMARANKVDGIIGVTFSDVEEYLDDTLAFVSIERRFSKNIPCVSGDNYLGGRMAAENLVRRGATNLLLVQTIMSVDNEVRKRRLGFEGYCEENEIPYASITFSEKQVPSVYSSFSARSLIGSVLQAHMNNQMTENGRPNGIFAGTDHLAVVIQEELEQDDTLAFVSIERRFSKNIPCVSGDNYLGGRMAAENLVRRGATNLLLVQTIMSVDNEVRKRRLGFEGYCEENEIPYASITFSEKQVPSVYSSFSARSLIGSVLQAHMNNQMTENGRPNGIFAGTDHLAVVIQEELEQMGLRVPEDVQLVGYDGLRWMNTGQPFVSSIYQDTGIIAKTSVDCLMRLLNGEAVEDILDLPIVFQDGGTTLPLPETDIKEKKGIILPVREGEDRR